MNNNDDEELEQDVLKLQIHSIPLNLNWDKVEEEYDDESDEELQQIDATITETSTQDDAGSKPGTSSQISSPAYDSQDEYGSADEEFIDLSANFSPTPMNMLKLNFAYQEVIEQQIAIIDRMLQENHFKKSVILENMNRSTSQAEKIPRLEAGLFNKLLFKDHRGVGPFNPDVERIQAEIGPGFSPNFVPPTKWKKLTDNSLITGVEVEARRKAMEPLLAQLEHLQAKMAEAEDEREIKSKIDEVNKKIVDVRNTPRAEIVGDRWKDWDWESIANMCLNNQQDATNCALRWKNHLHPSINHSAWTKEEDEKLVELVQKYPSLDWRIITAELGSNRTMTDVVRRFQLRINPSFKTRPWTPEEDALLVKLVEKYRVGSVVPYSQIALYMKDRNSTQLLHRWTKSLDPSIKRSKFSPQEDAALMRAVKLHGEKWARIRDQGLIPGRSDAQLRERYKNVLEGNRRSSWTKEEDLKLIALVDEIGEGNWTAIAARLEDRVDCQCLRRWSSLKAHFRKGDRVAYRRDRSGMSSLMKVRHKLRKAIDAEPVERKGAVSQNVENDRKSSHDAAMSSDALVSIYSSLTSDCVSQSKKRIHRHLGEDRPFAELYNALDMFYQPMMAEALREGTTLNRFRECVSEKSQEVGAKEIFVHFIRALNINVERTLETIKKKSKRQQTGTIDANASKENRANGNHVNKPAVASSQELERVDPTKKSVPFERNLYLPLCAPNRATLQAYRALLKDRDSRVEQAKKILLLPDADVEEEEGRHHPEELLARLRASYKYKIFRSRFNALFTWPTLLSSLVPYARKARDMSLYPVVRRKRNYLENSHTSSKKRKLE